MEAGAAAAEPRAAERDHQRLGHEDPVPGVRAGARRRDGGPADLFAADVRAELRGRPADVVVGNFFVFGAQIAAEAEGVPFAFLVSTCCPSGTRAPLRSDRA
jgi:hypothetical protein